MSARRGSHDSFSSDISISDDDAPASGRRGASAKPSVSMSTPPASSAPPAIFELPATPATKTIEKAEITRDAPPAMKLPARADSKLRLLPPLSVPVPSGAAGAAETGASSAPVIHSVVLGEFDLLKGNSISQRYPADAAPLTIDDELLASLCFPDGGHLHEDDVTYMTLNTKGDSSAQSRTVYGVSYFCNHKDPTVTRGAVQKALLVLSARPLFEHYEPVLKAAMTHLLADKLTGAAAGAVLKTLHETLTTLGDGGPAGQSEALMVWDQHVTIPPALPIHEGQFGGASVLDLLRLFREDVLIFWYAMLAQKRILFSGRTARVVSRCSITLPLLVAPLVGFIPVVTPYVCLNDTKPVEQAFHISGTTNQIFETHKQWFDVLGQCEAGTVAEEGKDTIRHAIKGRAHKINRWDRPRMENLLHRLDANTLTEEQARKHFVKVTMAFLNALGTESVEEGPQKALLMGFATNPMFAAYHKVYGSVPRPVWCVPRLTGSASDVEHPSAASEWRTIESQGLFHLQVRPQVAALPSPLASDAIASPFPASPGTPSGTPTGSAGTPSGGTPGSRRKLTPTRTFLSNMIKHVTTSAAGGAAPGDAGATESAAAVAGGAGTPVGEDAAGRARRDQPSIRIIMSLDEEYTVLTGFSEASVDPEWRGLGQTLLPLLEAAGAASEAKAHTAFLLEYFTNRALADQYRRGLIERDAEAGPAKSSGWNFSLKRGKKPKAEEDSP